MNQSKNLPVGGFFIFKDTIFWEYNRQFPNCELWSLSFITIIRLMLYMKFDAIAHLVEWVARSPFDESHKDFLYHLSYQCFIKNTLIKLMMWKNWLSIGPDNLLSLSIENEKSSEKNSSHILCPGYKSIINNGNRWSGP